MKHKDSKSVKVAFDIGGVLSKYPHIFKPFIQHLFDGGADVHIITDMSDREHTLNMLLRNGLDFIHPSSIHNADYATHGELCKSIILKEQNIDIFIDDFPGYLTEGCPVRLQLQADPREPYYHDDWHTDGSECTFGRRKIK